MSTTMDGMFQNMVDVKQDISFSYDLSYHQLGEIIQLWAVNLYPSAFFASSFLLPCCVLKSSAILDMVGCRVTLGKEAGAKVACVR
jgi:hypothetical protein